MPRVGWSVEQRAAVKRYMLFATLFAVAGTVFSIFLIVVGNSGGWVVLAMIACMYLAGFLFIGNIKREQS
ncbi:hypothetical protein [Streptomyces sp. ICN903]|uniref:hypothetical protein n=1 Tax=Streptomyces sp. ICN903 TaxID=2964654 RepID=UPI001EDB95FE|nr:hypothetical protein [Streptomyces sp. ICN903]